MPNDAPPDPVAAFAKDLRDRRGYMQERAPTVSARERMLHVGIIVAIALALLIAKVVTAVCAEPCVI